MSTYIRNPNLPCLHKQRGAVLMLMLVILVVGATAMMVNSLNSAANLSGRSSATSSALAQAKEALIGDSASQSSISSAGYLSLPDLGFSTSTTVLAEGSSPSNFAGNSAGFSLIGKLPWKKLSTPALRDSAGECLWYIVSGRFKDTPLNVNVISWDTLGQIDVIDGSGNPIASNIAALLVAPGHPIDGQSHNLLDPIYTQCGGNYNAQNYLDSFNQSDAVSGQVNYFTGSTNNNIATNTNNKQFVLANNSHYNDQFMFVTVDDIFRPIIHRSDFSQQITNLMNDSYFQAVPISSAATKGTANVNCLSLSTTANKNFCTNWKDMLLLKSIPTSMNMMTMTMSSSYNITIDGSTTNICPNNRLLIFGGQKTSAQLRVTPTDISNPANYLESTNLSTFNGSAGNFVGTSTFNANSPSADVIKCL